MKDSFIEAVTFTFQAEGWHNVDSGGDTILGIAAAEWPKEHAEIAKILPNQAAIEYARNFYHEHFWNFIDADNLTYPLDCVAFDSAVNPGQGWCKRQLDAGVKSWRSLLVLREQHYEQRAQGNPGYPLKGLLNRVNALRTRYEECA